MAVVENDKNIKFNFRKIITFPKSTKKSTSI